MFDFTITAKQENSRARTGILQTPHGEIETPVFMPVGTKATVKTLSPVELDDLNAEIILANTYHLYLRPGSQLIREMGGLHKWMNWNKPILTDSGGFQVFSLAQEKGHSKNGIKTQVKIDDNGVTFKSHLDGKKHYLTPEQAIAIQTELGADIIMAFDECAPADSSEKYLREAMQRTHNWLIKCKNEHQKLSTTRELPQALFGIVQGGIYTDLRKESAKFINESDLPGNAIGGLSVGESKELMYAMTETCTSILTEQKPRYLMGVGTPEDLLECVDRGIDMFDCVHPTRMGRHGAFWTKEGRFTIRKEENKKSEKPLMEGCNCYCCQNFSRSYLRHLIFEKEILGLRLITIHNLHFLIDLMKNVQLEIKNNTFTTFKKEFLNNFKISA